GMKKTAEGPNRAPSTEYRVPSILRPLGTRYSVLGAYFRMLAIFYKSTLITELEYRLNFWSNVGLSLFWLVWAALGVRVFFYHTDQIAGWTYNQLLIVVGLFFAMNGYRQAVLQPNLGQLSDYVRLG